MHLDLITIKEANDSHWLEYLRKNTVLDVDRIKTQKEWLIKQAEKVEDYKKEIIDLRRKANLSCPACLDEDCAEWAFDDKLCHDNW